MSTRIGIVLPARGPLATGAALATVAERAERAGYASVWATDHIIFPSDIGRAYPHTDSGVPKWDHQSSWVEALTALTWAGARTTRIRLGTAVLVLPLRSALHVAKQVASLDHLTGGRVTLGVGAGWLKPEFEYMDSPFEQRGKRLSEGMQVLRACWSPDPITFVGEFHHVEDALMQPKPVQGSGLPMLVGGHSEAALRRTVQLGDGWLASQLSPDEIRDGVKRLAELAAAEGRDPADLQVHARIPTGSTLTAATIEDYRAAGADELLIDVHTTASDVAECIDRMDEVAHLAGLRAAPGGGAPVHEETT